MDNGKYVYYVKDLDVNNDVASLYCYRIGEADPLRVASDLDLDEICFATDGSLFFFKETEKIPGTYHRQGTLMLWTYGNESASKISSEVVCSSVTSELDDEIMTVDTKNFIFMKYNEVDSDGNILVDWVYHDGNEATKFANDIILFEAPAKAPAEAPAADW